MTDGEANPYAVETLIEDPAPRRGWYASFPALLWIGTIAYVGFTVTLLRGAGDDVVAGRWFLTNAIWLGFGAVMASTARTRASIVVGVAAIIQTGIWAAMLFGSIGRPEIVNQILGIIVGSQAVLAFFYLWRETVGMSLDRAK